MPSLPLRSAAALLLVLTACGGPPPPVPDLALLATGDTVVTPYGDISAAAPLGGTRWVAVAPQEPAVGVADFGTHTLAPFAGRASRELVQPFTLFAAGDSIFIADWQKRRVTVWTDGGTLAGTIPANDALRGEFPRGRDRQGRWYFEVRPAPGPDGSGNRDSAAIVRTTGDLAARDTIARLAPPELVEVVTDGRRRMERRLLSGQDRWGLLPDGRIWVARVGQNRVDWRAPDGALRTGIELPDPVLPVTDNDRDIFLGKFDPALRATVAQTPFAVIKPPFEEALTDPTGRVWLIKSRAIGDSVRSYQVIGGDGKPVLTMTHPGLGRILALSDSLALVGEPFAAGTRLLLFRIPAPLPPQS